MLRKFAECFLTCGSFTASWILLKSLIKSGHIKAKFMKQHEYAGLDGQDFIYYTATQTSIECVRSDQGLRRVQVMVIQVAALWKLPINEGLDEACWEVHQRKSKQRPGSVAQASRLHRKH